MKEEVRTRCATLRRTGPNEVEIHFSPNVLLDKTAIAEVIGERKRLCADTPTGLLLVVPFETEVDVAIINTDHQNAHQATDNILGLAVVAGSVVSETLLRLYKAYYPQKFAAEVFTDQDEARLWLKARIAEAISSSN